MKPVPCPSHFQLIIFNINIFSQFVWTKEFLFFKFDLLCPPPAALCDLRCCADFRRTRLSWRFATTESERRTHTAHVRAARAALCAAASATATAQTSAANLAASCAATLDAATAAVEAAKAGAVEAVTAAAFAALAA